jgi:Tfp pilus assembly protein PilF
MSGSVMNTSMIYAQGRPLPKGSYRRNRNRIKRLIAKDPQTEYFFELARLEALRQDWERAQEAIEQLLQFDPTFWLGKLFLAQVLENKQEYEKAQHLYETVMMQQPESSIVSREYGRFLLSRESFSSARIHLLKALELDPRDAYAHALLAELYFLLGYRAQAVFHLKLGFSHHEQHPFYFPQSARLFMSMGCYEEAAMYWKKAVQLEPKNSFFRSQLKKALKAKQKGLNERVKEVFSKK